MAKKLSHFHKNQKTQKRNERKERDDETTTFHFAGYLNQNE